MKTLNLTEQKPDTVSRMTNGSPFFPGTQASENPFFAPSKEMNSDKNATSDNENLTSPRFAGNPRLEAAYDNAPVLAQGESGDAVARVQETLVDDGLAMPGSTKPTGEMDGIFGSETFNTVWNFQDKHDIDTDGRVGHDTLDKLQTVVQNNDKPKDDNEKKACPNIVKFGKTFSSSLDVTALAVIPSADTRGGADQDIMFTTGGKGNQDALEINANASLSPIDINGTVFEHGVIATARVMGYTADYTNGKKASRNSTNSRDAEPHARAPWPHVAPDPGSPNPFLAGDSAAKGITLRDMPRHHFPKVHPKDPAATLEKISFKTVLDFWHVAKEITSNGTDPANLAFMANFQITLESNAEKSKNNNNWVGSMPNNKITRAIGCGKGSASPVLDKPITINDLDALIV